MRRRSYYGESPCSECGKVVTNAGFARSSHERAHRRAALREWEGRGLTLGAVIAYGRWGRVWRGTVSHLDWTRGTVFTQDGSASAQVRPEEIREVVYPPSGAS